MNKKWTLLGIVIILLVLGAVIFLTNNKDVQKVTDSDVAMKDVEDLNPADIKDISDLRGNFQPNMDLSFAHTVPGEYSEIFATFNHLAPGDIVKASLSSSTIVSGAEQTKLISEKTAEADENGVARIVWKITSYGDYRVDGDLQTRPNETHDSFYGTVTVK